MGQKRQSLEDAGTRIATILNKVRSFEYEPELLEEADRLVEWADKQENSLNKFRAISLAIEIYNEYGRSDISKSTIEMFEDQIENEFKGVSPNAFENLSAEGIEEYKKRLEQLCWISAAAAVTCYWLQEINEGLSRIQQAKEIVNDYLTKEHQGVKLDSYGLRARLSYYAALLSLQHNDLKSAEEELSISLEFAEQRYSRLVDEHQNESNYWESREGLREARYTNVCVAKIQGFAKARVHQLRGELKLAAFLSETAEIVLRQVQSPTMSQMIRLWLYKIRRSLAGRDVEKLSQIIKDLKDCHAVFSSNMGGAQPTPQNRYYALLAAFEIGLSSAYKAQGIRHIRQKYLERQAEGKEDTKAEERLKALENEYDEALQTAREYAREIGENLDAKGGYWEFSKELLLSRIERETDGDKAKTHADNAARIAEEMKRSDLILDAYIAVGEALLKLYQSAESPEKKLAYADEALEQFDKAEKKNNAQYDEKKNEFGGEYDKNRARIRAVCCLRKAEAYVALNNKYEALRMLDEWELLSNQIEFKVIHYIARKVKDQLDGFIGDFYISKDTPHLNLKEHQDHLKEWLARITLSRHKSSKTQKKLDPKWLEEDMGISLSNAYALLTQVEGDDWKRKKRPSKRDET